MGLFKPKKVDLSEKGLAKVLGELESQIMNCIWHHEQDTVREICDCLNMKRKISFNALNTVINRMVEKEILLKKKDGSYYYYRPALSEEEFVKNINSTVFSSLLEDDVLFNVETFVNSLPESKKKDILKALNS